MVCPYCGARNSEEAYICKRCGSSINKEKIPKPVNRQAFYSQPDELNTEALIKHKPTNVTSALVLQWITIILNIISIYICFSILFDITYNIERVLFVMFIYLLIFILLSLVLHILIIYKISKGRNWARFLLLILSLISGMSVFTGIQGLISPGLYLFLFFMSLLGTILNIIAVVFLFTDESYEWFKKLKKPSYN